MAIPFKDISYAQGAYNMAANHDSIIVMKMSGAYTGSKALYYDAQAATNYNNAVRAGKAIGMYHFAGGGNPITEANFFVGAVSPLADNDVLILDWEIENAQPVAWVQAFVNQVHSRTGVWPWVYMDISRLDGMDWSAVFKTCGLWCAAPDYGFDAKLPVKYTVIAQQGPIAGGVDTDMFFGTLAQFKSYGYHKPAPAPVPKPATPVPVKVDPAPIPTPVVVTTPPATVDIKVPEPPADARNWFITLLTDLLHGL